MCKTAIGGGRRKFAGEKVLHAVMWEKGGNFKDEAMVGRSACSGPRKSRPNGGWKGRRGKTKGGATRRQSQVWSSGEKETGTRASEYVGGREGFPMAKGERAILQFIRRTYGFSSKRGAGGLRGRGCPIEKKGGGSSRERGEGSD